MNDLQTIWPSNHYHTGIEKGCPEQHTNEEGEPGSRATSDREESEASTSSFMASEFDKLEGYVVHFQDELVPDSSGSSSRCVKKLMTLIIAIRTCHGKTYRKTVT